MSAACYEDHVGSPLGEARPEVATNTACPHDCDSHKTPLSRCVHPTTLSGGGASKERPHVRTDALSSGASRRLFILNPRCQIDSEERDAKGQADYPKHG